MFRYKSLLIVRTVGSTTLVVGGSLPPRSTHTRALCQGRHGQGRRSGAHLCGTKRSPSRTCSVRARNGCPNSESWAEKAFQGRVGRTSCSSLVAPVSFCSLRRLALSKWTVLPFGRRKCRLVGALEGGANCMSMMKGTVLHESSKVHAGRVDLLYGKEQYAS